MILHEFHFVFGLRAQTEPWGPPWDRIRPHLQLRPLEPGPFVVHTPMRSTYNN